LLGDLTVPLLLVAVLSFAGVALALILYEAIDNMS
jgi:hypothetical protein